MPDQELKCREEDCGATFTHSEGEQAWMREKWGDEYAPPTRCRACRKKRRDEKRQAEQDERQLHD